MDKRVTLQMLILIIMTDVGESIAQLFMKAGLNGIGVSSITLSNFAEFASKSASSPLVWLGVGVYIVNFFIWITILSRVDLSVAVPVGSTSYLFVPMLSIIFLHETVSPVRWLGIAFIIAGIHFVAKSAEPQTMPL